MDCGRGKIKVLIEYWDAQRIRHLYRTKQKSRKELAKEYGISEHYIVLIVKNKCLREPEDSEDYYSSLFEANK
jgi:hypothetical protein